MTEKYQLKVRGISPEICAMCPRRSPLNRLIARVVLGSEHQGAVCDPKQIVADGDLKNQLYTLGLVDQPYGIMPTKEFQDQIKEGAPTKIYGGSPKTRALNSFANIRIGLSDQVCPLDVPLDYRGKIDN
ncbi:hypothetical protein A3E76_06300 [Candidatus Saccharibacteria bacterium RIFCSPHIGHO2_12_FULL_44_22]|nr:MAG: hypothetical protein A3E76_06300 [Candidatus Saccharibacteria bacterium RIFCSPHIGHO2_12_FULL_44_22]